MASISPSRLGFDTVRHLLLVFLGLLAATPARATLYEDLGAGPGIDHIVDAAIERFQADPRVAPTFEDTNMARFRTMLATQLCELADGPCHYAGHDMKAAHRGLKLDRAAFNALAEDLQDAMTTAGIGYHTQNRLMALLAPMERDVVSR